MEEGYFIPEKDKPLEQQVERNLITEIRVSKVYDYLVTGGMNLIPFPKKSPLVKDLDYSNFEKEIQSENLFEDLPRYIKKLVYEAEQMKHYDTLFKKYLEDRDITIKEYKQKNPKIKSDLFYDWLFLNKMDIGILNM